MTRRIVATCSAVVLIAGLAAAAPVMAAEVERDAPSAALAPQTGPEASPEATAAPGGAGGEETGAAADGRTPWVMIVISALLVGSLGAAAWAARKPHDPSLDDIETDPTVREHRYPGM